VCTFVWWRRQERAAAADLKEQLAAAQLQLEAAQLQPRSATAVPVIATCDAACQAPPAPASEEWLSDTSSNWGTTGDSQHDGVAAAAQQIALHADAASRACQEAAHLQHQVWTASFQTIQGPPDEGLPQLLLSKW